MRMTPTTRPARRAGALAVAWLALVGAAWAQAPATEPSDEPGCVDCHQQRGERLKMTPHQAIDSEGLASGVDERDACRACHGERGGAYDLQGALSDLAREQGCRAVFSFGPGEAPISKMERCLGCHRDQRSDFHAGRHALAGMDCTACHTICTARSSGNWPLQRALTQYGSALQPEVSSAVCWECHGDVVAQFELSERHRLQEGIVECTSCHDPHRPQDRELLGGLKQEKCAACHADKTGPFFFEHGANRVEGCTACHSPHGSPNRHMLSFQSVAELCLSCHAALPAFHARFTLDTICTNCHSSIHGSFLSPYFLE